MTTHNEVFGITESHAMPELQKRIRRSPQAVPMTDEQALGYWKIAAKASSRYSPAEAYYKGIADAEAHHDIKE